MKEWFDEKMKKYKEIFSDYGKIIFVTILFLICCISMFLILEIISPQKLRVSFLDVGQGDAILIQTPSGKNMLIDGGPGNVVSERVANKMSYFNRDIDVMVVTHPDADHVTGLIPILEKYNVKKIVSSMTEGDTKIFSSLVEKIENENSEKYIAEVGDEINFHDGVIAKILYPTKNYFSKNNDTNNSSVSMEIVYGNETFLLTGDLPSTHEGKIINGLNKNITVFKAGHHGSKYSNGEQLLTYIKPEYVIISAGKNNRYGHPNLDAIKRIQKYTKEILSTIDKGTISFITNGRNMEIIFDR